MKKLYIALALAVMPAIYSCKTLQKDIIMSTDSQVQNEDILYLEQKLSRLDALSIMSQIDQKELSVQCRDLDAQIDSAISELGMNKALLARLYAIKGLCALLSSSKSQAKTDYNLSLEASKGDSQTIILAERLGLIKDLEDENLASSSNQSALLILERAIINYNSGNYNKSIACFDEAFLVLPKFYAQNYKPLRTKAGELRAIQGTTASSEIMAYLKADTITIGQMLLIAQDTNGYIQSLTKGKKQSEKTLFKTAQNARLFNSASKEDAQIVQKDQKLTKRICARFLWNIKAALEGEGFDKARYSKIFSENDMDSPVSDIDVQSPDFDAVLGCIETEIINMDDGDKFLPEQNVSGRDFSQWLNKVR